MKPITPILISIAAALLGLGAYFWFRANQPTFERAQKHCACLVLMDQSPVDCEKWTQISESSVSRPDAKTLRVANFNFDFSDPQSGCRWLPTRN